MQNMLLFISHNVIVNEHNNKVIEVIIMRRKRKKHIMLRLIIIVLIFMSVIGVSYSYLSGVLKITGQVSGERANDYVILPGSDPNLIITSIDLNNTWKQGNNYYYQYDFNVKNIGQIPVDLFSMTVNFINNIKNASVPNYDYSINDKTLTITNSNYVIASGQMLNISITISSKSAEERVESLKFEIAPGYQVPLSEFDVNFSISNEWGQYTYQYNVKLTNKTGSKVSSWQLGITLPSGTSFVSGWNGIYSFNNQILIIKSESYNGKINNNSSITIGLQLSTNIFNFIPSDIIVTIR